MSWNVSQKNGKAAWRASSSTGSRDSATVVPSSPAWKVGIRSTFAPVRSEHYFLRQQNETNRRTRRSASLIFLKFHFRLVLK